MSASKLELKPSSNGQFMKTSRADDLKLGYRFEAPRYPLTALSACALVIVARLVTGFRDATAKKRPLTGDLSTLLWPLGDFLFKAN